MTRVHVVCEGPTEILFVNVTLQARFSTLHLIPFLPGKNYSKRQRGGDIKYDRVKPDIMRVLKHDRACYCTTLLDFYGLGRFPAKEEPRGSAPENKAARIELAVGDDIAEEMGPGFDRSRFFPYLSVHEFEALLFSDPRRLAEGLGREELAGDFLAVRNGFETPEHINDDPLKAPSKRLKSICRGYDKPTGGNIAALAVGLDAMARECPHFRRWTEWLGTL